VTGYAEKPRGAPYEIGSWTSPKEKTGRAHFGEYPLCWLRT